MQSPEHEIAWRITRERRRLARQFTNLIAAMDQIAATPLTSKQEAQLQLNRATKMIEHLQVRLDVIENLYGIRPLLAHEIAKGASPAQIDYILRNFPHEGLNMI